jgi:hypothetical protein
MKEWSTQFDLDIPVDRYADLFVSDRVDFHNRFHHSQKQIPHTQEKWSAIPDGLICRPGPVPSQPQVQQADLSVTGTNNIADVIIEGDLIGADEAIEAEAAAAASVEQQINGSTATEDEIIDLGQFLVSPKLYGISPEGKR